MKTVLATGLLLALVSSCKTVSQNNRHKHSSAARPPVGQPSPDNPASPQKPIPKSIKLPAQAAANKPFLLESQSEGVSTYRWSQKSGPGKLTFSLPSQPSTMVEADVDGTYIVVLEGIGTDNQSVTAEMPFTWDTKGPEISVTKDFKAFMPIDLNATVSEDATSLEWTKVSGAGDSKFDNPGAAKTMFSASANDTYVLRLTAKDALQNVTRADVNVLWNTTDPMVMVGSDLATNKEVSVTAMDKGAVTYSWTKVSGPGTITFSAPTSQTTRIKAAEDGDYVIRLVAVTNTGREASDELTLTWDTTPPQISAITIKPVSYEAYGEFEFGVDVKDAASVQWSYSKAQNPEGRLLIPFDRNRSTIVRAIEPGPYEIQVEAQDSLGNAAKLTRAFTPFLPSSPAKDISTSGTHSCVILESNNVRCWGYNYDGQIGDYSNEPTREPGARLFVNLNIRSVAANKNSTCAVAETGDVYCWGRDIADAKTVHRSPQKTKTPENFSGQKPLSITLAYNHACVILEAGDVSCWAANVPWAVPSSTVSFAGRKAKSLVMGLTHVCALLDEGSVTCWGGNENGQLGLGDFERREVPDAKGVPLGRKAISIAGDTFGSCAILDDHTIKCWGSVSIDVFKESIRSPIPQPFPGMSGGLKPVELAFGAGFHCYRSVEGTVQCKGSGFTDISGTYFALSTAIDLGKKATRLVAADFLGCALLVDGTVRCWATQFSRALGYGSYITPSMPHPPVPL